MASFCRLLIRLANNFWTVYPITGIIVWRDRRKFRARKPLFWVGSAKRDLLDFPEPVKDEIGIALSVAQFGGKHPKAKPWKGEGAGIFLAIVEDGRGDTYRPVYTVRFSQAVYVLHAFQKKSPRGIITARPRLN